MVLKGRVQRRKKERLDPGLPVEEEALRGEEKGRQGREKEAE